MCRDATETYGGEVWSPNRARRFCTEQLAAVLSVGALRDAVTDDATIIASELVTNSVNAGSGRIRIMLSIHRDHLRLTVRDDANGHPRRRSAAAEDPRGRGLAIIELLARAWGVEPAADGKQVWAELGLPAELTGDLECRI